jgi:hypothetical protein
VKASGRAPDIPPFERCTFQHPRTKPAWSRFTIGVVFLPKPKHFKCAMNAEEKAVAASSFGGLFRINKLLGIIAHIKL